jgi:hypothetical protein
MVRRVLHWMTPPGRRAQVIWTHGPVDSPPATAAHWRASGLEAALDGAGVLRHLSFQRLFFGGVESMRLIEESPKRAVS